MALKIGGNPAPAPAPATPQQVAQFLQPAQQSTPTFLQGAAAGSTVQGTVQSQAPQPSQAPMQTISSATTPGTVQCGGLTGLLTPEQSMLIIEGATLKSELEPFSQLVKRGEEIRQQFVAIIASAGAQFPSSAPVKFTAPGGESLTFSAAQNQRNIKDMGGLLKVLREKLKTPEAVYAMIKISMEDLGKVLSAAELAPFIETVEGPRKLSAYSLAPK